MANDIWKSDLGAYLPHGLREAILALDPARSATLEEIRIRVDRPIGLRGSDFDVLLENVSIDAAACADLMESLCEHSIYAFAQERNRGFFTLKGGYRVGLCGRAGVAQNMADVTGFNIRIAREWWGCAAPLMPHLLDDAGRPLSALLLSPPGVGKTTMLRDIARQFSDGVGCAPRRVAIADERSEIAGSHMGTPTLTVGLRTDVMDGYPKAQAMQMLIRTMSPELLITDEIGGAEDAKAIADARRCGVAVIASAHAADVEAAMQRECLGPLLKRGAFSRVIELYRVEDMVCHRIA